MFFFTLQLSFSFLLNFKKIERETFSSFPFSPFSFNIIRIYFTWVQGEVKNAARSANKRIIQEEFEVERRRREERRKSFSIIFTWMKFYLLLWVRTKVIAGISSFREWAMIKFLNSSDLWWMKQYFFVILIEKCSLYFRYRNI